MKSIILILLVSILNIGCEEGANQNGDTPNVSSGNYRLNVQHNIGYNFYNLVPYNTHFNPTEQADIVNDNLSYVEQDSFEDLVFDNESFLSQNINEINIIQQGDRIEFTINLPNRLITLVNERCHAQSIGQLTVSENDKLSYFDQDNGVTYLTWFSNRLEYDEPDDSVQYQDVNFNDKLALINLIKSKPKFFKNWTYVETKVVERPGYLYEIPEGTQMPVERRACIDLVESI